MEKVPSSPRQPGGYRIVRAIGNNFVCAKDSGGHEVVLRGPGIGFKKSPGDVVAPSRVEKVYALQDHSQSQRLTQLMVELPPEYLEVSTQIIESAERLLNRRLSGNVYITLTDHISFALQRHKNGVYYPNQLLWEIKTFYAQEYEVGQMALEIIESALGVRLPEDEAGFIALHIVNAQLDGHMSDMVRITQLVREIMAEVADFYGAAPCQQGLDYERLITHLKFLGQRLARPRPQPQEDATFQGMIRAHYPQAFQCALQVRARLKRVFDLDLPGEELTFLTVHLQRLALAMGQSKEEKF